MPPAHTTHAPRNYTGIKNNTRTMSEGDIREYGDLMKLKSLRKLRRSLKDDNSYYPPLTSLTSLNLLIMSSPSATTPPMTRVEKGKPTTKACLPVHATHYTKQHNCTGIKNNTRIQKSQTRSTPTLLPHPQQNHA